MKRYTWSVIVFNHDLNVADLLPSEFHTKENASLFAEAHLYDRVIALDGLKRDPATVFTTQKEIEKIVGNSDIKSFDSHFIVSKGWTNSIVKVKIYMAPVTTTKTVEEVKEIEEEEEYQEKEQIKTLIPGRIYNSYKTEEIFVNKKRSVKKQITVAALIETVSFERVVVTKEIVTASLCRKEIGSVQEEYAQLTPFIANFFSIEFNASETCKSIQRDGECIPSKLKKQHPGEFEGYKLKTPFLKRIHESGYHPLAPFQLHNLLDTSIFHHEFNRQQVGFHQQDGFHQQVGFQDSASRKGTKTEKRAVPLASLSGEIAEAAKRRLSKLF